MNQPPPSLLLPKLTEGLEPGTFLSYLALLSFVTLVAGVVYDWGYVTSLGLSFGQVPMSIADHTESAFLWLPLYALALFLVTANEIITRRVEDGKQEDEIAPPGTRVRGFRDISRWLPLLIIALTMALVFVLRGEDAILLGALAFAMLWSQIALWVVKHPIIGGGMDIVRRRSFYFAPSFAIILFALGWNQGLTALRVPRGTVEVITSDGVVSADLLRVYETGVLYRRDAVVGFRRWDSISAISRPARADYWRGLLPIDEP